MSAVATTSQQQERLVQSVLRASSRLAAMERSILIPEADRKLAFDRLRLAISRARHRGCWQLDGGAVL